MKLSYGRGTSARWRDPVAAQEPKGRKSFPCRLSLNLILVALLVEFLSLQNVYAVTTIIGDGDDLVAAVAAAAHNDIIEIRSNETFVGTLSWRNKYLTIQAGTGFQPTVKGSPAIPDLFGTIVPPAIQAVTGTLGTGGEIRGLRLEPGISSLQYNAVQISGTSTRWSNMTFLENEFSGSVQYSGTGNLTIDSYFERNRFHAPLRLSGTGNLQINVVAEQNLFHGSVSTSGTGDARIDLDLHDNFFLPTPDSPATVAGIYASGTGRVRADIHATNNVVVGERGIGIYMSGISQSAFTGSFVNNTVVGFDTGLSIGSNATATFENMLLYNADDVGGFSGGAIRNSLISDGTFHGLFGNLGGVPLLGSQYELLPGSIGIDAANNAALGLPSFDILGRPRILDGNNDGIARVDVGAFELFIPEPTTVHLALFAVTVMSAIRRR